MAEKSKTAGVWFDRVTAALFILLGIILAIPGAWLLYLGGSSYYLIAGLGLFASGVLLLAERRFGVLLFFALLGATGLWSLWEVGADGWALFPRLNLFLGLALLLGIGRLWEAAKRRPVQPAPFYVAAVAAVAAMAALYTALDLPTSPRETVASAAPGAPEDGDWPFVGGSSRSERYSGLQQLTPTNVSQLRLAWKTHLGLPDGPLGVLEATPLKVGDLLYMCNTHSEVFALDPDTGKIVWRFDPKLDKSASSLRVCRGVAYHRQPTATGHCAERIVAFALDARMFAIDAKSGQRCPGFGTNGEVSLLQGMGKIEKEYYTVTSAPTIVRNKVIVGGFVMDGQQVGEASGAIRAFDVVTGKFGWAWDVGRPGEHGLPPAGQGFTPGTPNAWAPITGDDALGLAYVPTGAPTPDYVSSHRTPEMNKYSNSVVALDVETGAPRWSFQTSHLDVWDYDVASPATLIDFKTPQGLRPALIQPTKRGQFFILDRRTGQPLVETVERTVPQGPVPGERLSPTQPYSVGMPSFGGARLTEADMWGATALDQLWCRIKFREARYEGDFTPVGLQPSIVYPGYLGGSEWAGISVDPARGLMVLNVNHFAMYNRMLPRVEANRRGIRPYKAGPPAPGQPLQAKSDALTIAPQAGTDYAVQVNGFVSPLDIPCIKPPYSEIAVVDLDRRKTVWRQPLGTARDSGPANVRFSLPIRMGVPAVGGPLVTRSGLIFIAATQERSIRAFELKTGRLLWQARLPAGGHAAPMTYYSRRSGRQFVVIPASGHFWMKSGKSDGLLAYALPPTR
jgi:quinoprotein glucose dehydrogenase